MKPKACLICYVRKDECLRPMSFFQNAWVSGSNGLLDKRRSGAKVTSLTGTSFVLINSRLNIRAVLYLWE